MIKSGRQKGFLKMHIVSAALAVYYCHWEHQIFSALQLAIVRALKEVSGALNPRLPADSVQPVGPLFSVSWNQSLSAGSFTG